ncbi:PiggyBac transposable element-derived protein 4 [Trichinella zimbabwensis]|uniref:PiggyBac transposable element-derived protein 4 n=1 Tax=Trichinella zimbabwensis TaxID=268475 RepID=A0A0V1GZ14_9BILA|nr:PiggyBac transposable element-derived protein 4 [Trichinella zimbabwensis]
MSYKEQKLNREIFVVSETEIPLEDSNDSCSLRMKTFGPASVHLFLWRELTSSFQVGRCTATFFAIYLWPRFRFFPCTAFKEFRNHDSCCFLYLPRNGHRIFLSVGAVISARLVLSSCLSYIFFIYSIFSQTVQSLSLISWLRVSCLIVNDFQPYTDEDEIKALLGLLLLAGVFHSSRLNLCDLYDTDGTGVEIFSSTMSLERLRFLLRCMRFDDHLTCSERKLQDKLAAIRMVFDSFVRNCTENYMHSPHATIDEVLLSFKGRCPFRVYIPSKAAKYGIKIFELSDSEMYYVSKMEVYVGKQNEGPHQMDTSPAAVVKRLCSAIVGSGRNITMDN